MYVGSYAKVSLVQANKIRVCILSESTVVLSDNIQMSMHLHFI